MAENKRITLHPLKPDGTIDLSINLYPKTLDNAIVDENGQEVYLLRREDLDALSHLIAPDYTDRVLYKAGDIVVYDHMLYLCIENQTLPEEFDANKWRTITLSEFASRGIYR